MIPSSSPLAAAVDLSQPGTYLHWGVLHVSYGNALVIALMLVLFGLAVVLPFPAGREVR